ncbi:hypothetical protein FB192DRAFT_1394992 [Mucor lusitanicus]|uniref:YCII-related domain-containing protein n=1 Tax=Mucor circinelloides f. lusitanicus TaxID=29924 RepID=A0A8H4BCI3_MUCCL|nr:hypothetical protein FB192DRAFT_1394992 [Mucor lusitanicus]
MLGLTRKIYLNNARCFSSSALIKNKHHFMVVLHDFTDSEALNRRLSVRDQHLQGALKAESDGNLLVGGAILDNHESSKMKGSVLLLAAKSVEEIDEMIIQDPYYKAKVWEKWEVYPIKCAIGPK